MNLDTIFEAAYLNDAETLSKAFDEDSLDPNIADIEGGHTLLLAACETNALDCIRVILDAGADPNKRFTTLNLDGTVIQNESTALANVASETAAQLLIDAGADLDAIDGFGLSPVLRAAKRRDLSVVDFLCNAGADYKSRLKIDGQEMTPKEFIEKEVQFFSNALGDSLTPKQKKFFDEYEAVRKRLEN